MIIFIFCLILSNLAFGGVEEGNSNYIAGERSKTAAEKTHYFNAALSEYLKIEKEQPSSQLHLNIGNTLYQLEEYPLALLYYYRALNGQPRSQAIKENIRLAQSQLGLDQSIEMKFLSLKETAAMLAVLLIFLAFSLAVKFYRAALCLTITSLIFLFALGYERYFSPILGVMVKSSLLVREPVSNASPVNLTPVLSGEKVYILEVTQEGKWLKVRSSNHQVGYVDYRVLRIV